MQLEKFTGPGSTKPRRAFWDKIVDTILASQKREGKNVSVNECYGLGTIINAARERGTPVECDCPREVSEISGFTMSFTAHYVGDGVTSCPEDECSDTQTWTRIDSAESFSAPHQFKLYLNNCESGGEIVYEDNRSSSPISFDCFGSNEFVPVHGSFVYGSNSPNTGGCCNFVTVGNDVFYTMDFFAEGDNLCSNCVAELGDTEIAGLTICDMSALIGVYSVENECVDEFGGVWTITAQLEWF